MVHQITENTEKNEGRGPTRGLNIYFQQKSAALEFVKSKYYGDTYGVMGMSGGEHDIISVTEESLVPSIYYDVKEYEEKHHTNITLTRKQRVKLELNALSKEELIRKIMEG